MSTLVAVFKTGQADISLTAQWNEFNDERNNHIAFSVWVPDDYKEKTKGLLGNYDGDHRNEYFNRGGVPLPNICDPRFKEVQITNHMKTCK